MRWRLAELESDRSVGPQLAQAVSPYARQLWALVWVGALAVQQVPQQALPRQAAVVRTVLVAAAEFPLQQAAGVFPAVQAAPQEQLQVATSPARLLFLRLAVLA
jgi:hypothetical protein